MLKEIKMAVQILMVEGSVVVVGTMVMRTMMVVGTSMDT